VNLKIPSRPGPGLLVRVTPASAGWRHVGLEVLRLEVGRELRRRSAGREACVVLLSGRVDVSAGGQRWPAVGGRGSVFAGPPYAVYAPPGADLALRAVTAAEVAIGWAPAEQGPAPALLEPEGCRIWRRGSGSSERLVCDILMEDRPATSLLVTEVVTPGGHWSSWPPHKHDTDDPPRECYLEETYYHRIRGGSGFALQLVYTPDLTLDEAVRVSDGDVVLVPRGYHPVAAAPGHDLYYLNVMAGPRRQWLVSVDREFSDPPRPFR
jgi:5-deoxy-glucuronate isomerase